MQNITKTIKNMTFRIFGVIAVLAIFALATPAKAENGDYGSYSGYSDYGSYTGYSDYGSYNGYSDYGSYTGYSDYGSYGGYSDYGSYSGYGDYAYGGGYDYYDIYDVYDTYDYYGSGYGGGYSSYYPSYGGSYGGGYGGGFNFSYSDDDYTYTNTVTETCVGYNNCNVNQVAQNTNNLSGSCPTSGTYYTGQTVNWYANASGGSGSYTYSWSGDVSGSGSSISKSYSSTGTRRATVVITSGNQSITRDCSVNIVNRNHDNNDDLEAICIVSDTRVEVGDRVTFEVEIDGGERPYDIEWRGDIDGDDDEVTERFNREGRYEVSVRVEDDNGNVAYDDCATVVVDHDRDDDSNITLISNNVPTNGTLASGVFLSEIPYTGVGENLKMILFVLGMTLWSAFMAWVFLKKRAAKKGLTQSEMIAKFKADNLAKKQITA